jgi:hypothetical protein
MILFREYQYRCDVEGESAHFERETAGATSHRRFENLTDSCTTGKLINLDKSFACRSGKKMR